MGRSAGVLGMLAAVACGRRTIGGDGGGGDTPGSGGSRIAVAATEYIRPMVRP